MRNWRRLLRSGAVILAMLPSMAAAPRPESPVADAAMRGEVDTVRALLKHGADVNAAQGDGTTALHWAATRGDVDLARMLLYAGARVDAVTRNGNYTALHHAARAGSAAVVEALLDAGASPHATTTTGGATALHFAAATGSAETVSALLDGGAEVDARDSAWEQTPLMWAAAANRVTVVRVLLERGADAAAMSKVEDIAARERADRTALRQRNARMQALRAAEQPAPAAARSDSAAPDGAPKPDSVTETSQQNQEPDSTSETSRQTEEPDSAAKRPVAAVGAAAQAEAAKGKREPEPEPLTYGDLVGRKGGLTPLLFAARQGHVESVIALLDAGADIGQVSGDGTSALLIATINGHFDLAMLLLERGADPRLASDAGATPLYAALNVQWSAKSLYPQPTAHQQQRATYLELATALLDRGADPDARLEKHLWYMSYNFDLLGVNTAGATPFWRAAYATDVEAMRLLVARGADPNIPTTKVPERRRGEDAEEPASDDASGLPPVPVGGPGVWPIHAASGVGYGEGYAANAHRHVPDGWLPAVKYLIEELGADVNARDLNGYTPLHHAAARGDDELILYLVEKGADVEAVSRKGQTTADMANGPVQRVPPFPSTIELLERLGSKNSGKCRSC